MALQRASVYISAIDYLDRALELSLCSGPLDAVQRSYYAKFSRYVLSMHRSVPVHTLVIAQSPYNRDIFPVVASAMSYDPELTRGTFQEIPATVEVLANDISRTCRCEFDVPASWFRDSWIYMTYGVLVMNTRSITEEGSHYAEREAARLLSFLKRVVEASAARGAKSVVVYTLGNPAKDFGDKLRSCVDTTMIPLTVRSAPHPAYISRRHSDLRSPECTLGRPSFCRGLFTVIMATRKAQEAARERERDNLVRDLNALDTSGRKVASSYSEYIAMLESDTSSDVVPKQVALQMLTTLSDSIISMCESTRNVSTFIRMSSAGQTEVMSRRAADLTTKEPATHHRVPPGETRSVSSASRAPSVITESSKAMSPAEIRRARQNKGKSAASVAPATPATPAKPAGDTASEAGSAAPPATPTPAKPASARAQRMASRTKPVAPQQAEPSISSTVSDAEASAMAVMAEYISSNRDDADATPLAEQLMASVEAREAKSNAATNAVRAIRADAAKDPNYDVGKYLGLVGDASVVTSNTYQYCTNFPSWTFKA